MNDTIGAVGHAAVTLFVFDVLDSEIRTVYFVDKSLSYYFYGGGIGLITERAFVVISVGHSGVAF